MHVGLTINHHFQESITEENEDDSDSDLDDASVDSDRNNIFSPELKMTKDEDIEPKVGLSNQKNQIHSPNISPLVSPRTAPNNSSTNPDIRSSKRESKFLHLLSNRFRDSTISDSLSSSPDMSSDHVSNGDEVCQITPISSH